MYSYNEYLNGDIRITYYGGEYRNDPYVIALLTNREDINNFWYNVNLGKFLYPGEYSLNREEYMQRMFGSYEE